MKEYSFPNQIPQGESQGLEWKNVYLKTSRPDIMHIHGMVSIFHSTLKESFIEVVKRIF